MNFLWIVGPPAVGKMAVGKKISEKTGYKMLINHGTIELLVPIFSWEHPKFKKLNNEFRRRIFEEVATSDLPGFIFTYVTAYDDEGERAHMEKVSNIFKEQAHNVYYVELHAPLSVRLERNTHPDRLDAKPSKRDTEWSKKSVIGMDNKYPHLVSSEEFPFFFPENYIKIENSLLSPDEAAERVIEEFQLIKKV
ncbi:MAG: shikimate kinase [Promethearchaeota archaeon]